MHRRPRGSNRGRYESEEVVGDQRQNEGEDQLYPIPESSGWSASNSEYPYPLQATSAADDTNYGEENYTTTPSGGFGYTEERRETPRFEEGDEDDIDLGSSARQHVSSKASSRSHYHCPWDGCSRTFTSTHERDRHYRTVHANKGERPYRCEVPGCQASVTSWTRADKLRQHNKQWHGPYQCPQPGCSRGDRNGFGTQMELDTHVDEAHRLYGQSSTTPGFHENTASGYGKISAWGGSEQFGPSPSGTFSQVTSGYPTTQAGGPYSLQTAAPGSMTMPPQDSMHSVDVVGAAFYAGNSSTPVTSAEMNSLAFGMSRTKITDNVIKDNPVNSNSFDKLYKKQNRSFFKFGRVFKVSWSEPVGNAGTDISGDESSGMSKKFTKIRRFIVIKQRTGHCICLPVLTYSGRGVLKAGVHPHEHAPLYMRGKRPKLLEGEEERGLTRQAIEIVMDSSNEELHSTSRLNYAKVYTIEYNVKVCSVGRVSSRSEQVLARAYNEVHPPLEVGERPPSPASGQYSGNHYPPPTSTSTVRTESYFNSTTTNFHPLVSSGEASQYPYDRDYQQVSSEDPKPPANSYTAQGYPSDRYHSTPVSSAYPPSPHTSYSDPQRHTSYPDPQHHTSYQDPHHGYSSSYSASVVPCNPDYHNGSHEDPPAQPSSPAFPSQYEFDSSYTVSPRPSARKGKSRSRRYSSKSYDHDEANDLYEA